jgi:hypothetical protein
VVGIANRARSAADFSPDDSRIRPAPSGVVVELPWGGFQQWKAAEGKNLFCSPIHSSSRRPQLSARFREPVLPVARCFLSLPLAVDLPLVIRSVDRFAE